ncbi:phage N-6-adenine-methyltransferase [Aeromonas veronii]|nr:phage N-6-adenine-methyltransferase [Aeromonas veronii]
MPIFIDERHNALATPWTWFAMPGEYAWCNPPYSNIGPWVDAANEARVEGIGTVMLVMAGSRKRRRLVRRWWL